MKTFFLRLAKGIYRATPFLSVRKLCFGALSRLVKNKTVRATIDEMTYELDLGEMIDLCIFLREFEPDVSRAIDRYCQAGWTALDIGANIGAHTLRLARGVGADGRVFAFEPTDFAWTKLEKNVKLNPQWQIVPVKVALSDKAAAGQVVSFRSSWRTDGKRADGDSTVDFARLDDLCGAHGIDRVDIVKMDVDGNEYAVLTGAERLLARCKPLFVIECVGPHFENGRTNPMLLLKRLGYRFWDLTDGREYTDIEAMGELFPPNDHEMTFSINVLAAVERPAAADASECAT